MKVTINDIIVKDRYRKDKGDIEGLMNSIKDIGLLQPIGITKDNILVFGERRLTACFALGWDEIDARVVDVPSIIEGEFSENEVRKAFTPTERLAIAEAVEREVGKRQGSRTDVISFTDRKKELLGVRPQVKDGELTRDFAAKAAGFTSEKQRRRTEKIVKDGAPILVEAVDKGDVAITRAADIANLTKPEQIVSLAGEKADREVREEAEAALLHEVAQHKLYHPANAYTDYIEKHKKRPDRETAAGIGKLLGCQVKADDGTMQPPKTKAQKASEQEARSLRKEEEAIRLQCRSVTSAVGYLANCKSDPAEVIRMIDRWETPAIIENIEHAVEWLTRFAKEWRIHVQENNAK
ncbi:ParB/RepB/Spo0J family partition protein [Rhizobium sp.]|uniref:ParB/RepB/Spo0J family partition protein n=1 Tax=Rhizobium sp. TaxID=391 RepID=UPI0028A6CF22